VEVDLNLIGSNIRAVRAWIGPSRKLLCVVKANAYGHGAVAVARRAQIEGADFLGVAMVEEGIELRHAGIEIPILVLGGFEPTQIASLAEARLTPSVYSLGTLSALLDAGRRRGKPIPFHLEVDTGMGRLGLPSRDLGAALDRMAALTHPALEGIYTVLASGEKADSPRTAEQLRLFNHAVQEVKRRGLSPAFIHVANSGGVLNTPDTWFNMVRPGLAIYGVAPAEVSPVLDLAPALSFRTKILLLKDAPSGTHVGYGGAYTTDRESRIATLAVGYDDGLDRRLDSGGRVLIRGRRAPIVGRISMDLTTVDVTGIPGVSEGDEATIIGRQGDEWINVWEPANLCRTIPWELLCRIGSRVPRIYIGEGAAAPVASRFETPSRR
jgi:alanine racemase